MVELFYTIERELLLSTSLKTLSVERIIGIMQTVVCCEGFFKDEKVMCIVAFTFFSRMW